MPETGAVSLDGIVLQRVVVEFRPSHLAALGLTSADLEAAVPTDPAASSPGHLVLTPAAASAGLQAIENLPVHAGAKVFRLGDIALVARAPLDQPVFTLWQHGHPAVRLKIVTLDAR
jgi:multidrug efflux pump subunit AcrB